MCAARGRSRPGHGSLGRIAARRSIDSDAARLALGQQGNVTRQQLLHLGLTPRAIRHRLDAGRLHRVHVAVYSVGRPPQTALERAAAAVLACGGGAALSHFSAMALWGFGQAWSEPFHVTVPSDRRRPGIKIHRCPGLSRRDLRKHQGIWVTSPARTLLDCAPVLSDKRLARAVNDARLSGQLRFTALADVIGRFPHHPGAKRLAPFTEIATAPTRSEFEDAFLAFCERFDLPRPEINANVLGYEVDALFRDQKLIVELDGYQFHSSRASFERDRDRDASTLRGGYGTIRITWGRMNYRPEREGSRLRGILEARS